MVLSPGYPVEYGFINEPVGTHSSRTIMLGELTALLRATRRDASYEDLQHAAISENVVQKDSAAGRVKTFRHLRELYALNPKIAVFYAMRSLWGYEKERPLLAMLCASARDAVLRASADKLLAVPYGERIIKDELFQHLADQFPNRYSEDVLNRIARNMLSSWTQSGHLQGRAKKIRVQASAGPASTAYAIALGYLTGLRGDNLFGTFWGRILDCPNEQVHEYAFDASARGLISYRRAASVVEVTVSQLLPPEEH